MKCNRINLKDKETWRYIGVLIRHPEWTIKDWRKEDNDFYGEDDNDCRKRFISCSCCHKHFDDDEYPYIGAFRAAKGQYWFKIICKECAYKISDKVTEADGEVVVIERPKKPKTIRKYELENNSVQPGFQYLVQNLGHIEEYWLYNNFDTAYNKMKRLAKDGEGAYILEPYFAPKTREWKMRKTFFCFDNDVYHEGDKGEILLHAKFYVDAGEWKNPKEIS